MQKSNLGIECMAQAKNQIFQLKWNLLINKKGLLFYNSVRFSAFVFFFFIKDLDFSQKLMRIAYNNLGLEVGKNNMNELKLQQGRDYS